MAQRMAAEGVTAQQDDVQGQHQCADAEAEVPLVGGVAGSIDLEEPRRLEGIPRQEKDEGNGDVQEIAMDVLNEQRAEAFAPVALARLTNSAVGRIGPERLVVGTAIVVASHAEA